MAFPVMLPIAKSLYYEAAMVEPRTLFGQKAQIIFFQK